MRNALLPLLIQCLLLCDVLGDGTYECGEHGRFEYCIDEIPGCVIGCHCHPGYYFDTDTKICEPNLKLIDHRRNEASKPAIQDNIHAAPNIRFDTVSSAKTGKFDGTVDEIAKDANDLGDWLYNQFFKTIENQVINNTNEKDIMTRRSGSQPRIDKSKRRKKWRKTGKSTKPKGKKELRRKLLRITENDSLFDISSKSTSESSDSSSSSSDMSSMEFEVNENKRHKHDNDDHGHKKIIMINKKPTPPLPSFIFLPNLDTPYYPPIGLPAPPIVPMYPMVPVPPVPLCPITGCIENVDNTVATTPSTSTTINVTTSSKTTPTVTLETSETSSVSDTMAEEATTSDVNPADEAKTDAKLLRMKNRKKKMRAKLFNKDKTDNEQRINAMKYLERQKVLDRLREKISNNPSAKLYVPSWNRNKKIYANKFIRNKKQNKKVNPEATFLDNVEGDNELYNERIPKTMQESERYPGNVDFKYITELIHRVDLSNKSNNLPPIEYNSMDSMEMYEAPTMPFEVPNGRRINRPMQYKSDESYYANLGRQIATMIRGIDKKGIVELDPALDKMKNQPYFNKNTPTSFWERSVRSPLAYLKTKNKKFEYLQRSNELLFDIENKVEIIASTEPSLTLQEIENIVKTMEASKKGVHSQDKLSTRNVESSHNNAYIDLLPHKVHDVKNTLYVKKITHEKKINNYKTNKNNIGLSNNNLRELQIDNLQNLAAWNNFIKNANRSYNLPTTINPSFINKYYIAPANYNFMSSKKVPQIPSITNTYPKNAIKQSLLNQHINPYFLENKKYFEDNDSYYVNQNVKLPYFPPVARAVGTRASHYFPQVNHFDYVE